MKNWILLTVALLILSGCSGHYNTSGDKTVVTGVCKSCKPYYVRGSWHYPQNHYEYEEIGLASWYGPGFHGKPKPYGELFDQNAMTAAHKTLPLPTIVKVTNLENGQSVKVLIDDRGPFVYAGRIIDLSVAAAKAIGVYQKGVAKVRVQALVKESDALSQYLTKYGKKASDPAGRSWVQIYHQEIDGRYGHESTDSVTETKIPFSSEDSQKAMPVNKPSQKPFGSIDEFLLDLEPAKKESVIKPQHEPIKYPKDALTHMDKKEIIAAPSIKGIFIEVGGHFMQRINAEKLLNQVKNICEGKIVPITHPSGQKFFTVQIGPFSNSTEAQKALAQLGKMGHANSRILK